METPVIRLITDDDKYMQSELKVSVCTTLNVVEFEHITQRGTNEIFSIYPSDIDELVEFLYNAKIILDNE